MTDVLILGGTGWLSGRIARAWVEAGASVTCLARGGRPAPEGAALVVGDRDSADAYDAVAGREWDEVVDVSSNPAHVAAALEAVGARTAHWTYISSVSVYARADVVGGDEQVETLEPTGPGEPSDYGRDKAAAEASVRAVAGDRAAIVRPGLIVGPGDPTDRFGYWVSRFALAGDEPVLVPDASGASAQVIDVDDLAAFAVHLGRERWSGIVNAVGDVHLLVDVLELARTAAGHTGEVVVEPADELIAHGVAHWAGPKSLPLWLPDDMPGFMTWRNEGFRGAGGTLRPLAETVDRTLADERARGLDRERRAGLTRADELAILGALA
ncbi:nucleoside-diphosphate-sugar epimerase [Microbacterium terrae]|uniref:NAD dependent epimerase/dehydratase family protein n=1 Tax=Microbacterium terrae TaxID=69369 RepID=A0A0M2H5R3_9MICO|nr:NAD-dependent epimerase/dehydratase family protein [Microbacterium terrae]KJL39150.1 NAD dependent epimerase/dehydratase family protein [Microbacterium terrae]MBP1077695.1 nucleoside-diphosphate-sugar epimerase [Microbacterium terrae]GLJ99862.1 reductase [Microbacterium terrae]